MGSTARPRYIGLREISERDILELYCSMPGNAHFVEKCVLTVNTQFGEHNRVMLSNIQIVKKCYYFADQYSV